MTDKVQKIRSYLADMANADGAVTVVAKAINKDILPYIDSLQEEPVSEPQVIESAEIQHDKETCKENGNSLTQEPVNKDFEMALAEMIDKAQKCVVEPLVVAAQWKDELIKLAISKEPISENLEQAIDTYLATYWGGEQEKQDWPFLKKMAIHFAQWQKEQFEKNRLKHCNSITNEQAELEQGFIDQHLDKFNRMPTFLDAIEYGIEEGKEQMMKGSVEGFFYKVYNEDNSIDCGIDVPLDYSNCLGIKDKENVKVILIKEE